MEKVFIEEVTAIAPRYSEPKPLDLILVRRKPFHCIICEAD
jgi:hypothetical protein